MAQSVTSNLQRIAGTLPFVNASDTVPETCLSYKNSLADKFLNAWLNHDLSVLSECLADNVNYKAWPTNNSFKGNLVVIDHFNRVFNYLKDFNANTTLIYNKDQVFVLNYSFEALMPVTHYMVNSEGIFLVPCLEPRHITWTVKVHFNIKDQLINRVKIFQESISKEVISDEFSENDSIVNLQ